MLLQFKQGKHIWNLFNEFRAYIKGFTTNVAFLRLFSLLHLNEAPLSFIYAITYDFKQNRICNIHRIVLYILNIQILHIKKLKY